MPALTGLVGAARCPIEMEHEFKRGRQSSAPVARKPWSLIPHIPPEPPPSLLAHPGNPRLPIRLPFAVTVDQPQVDQHLPSFGHRQVGEYAFHQCQPIPNATFVCPLLIVG